VNDLFTIVSSTCHRVWSLCLAPQIMNYDSKRCFITFNIPDSRVLLDSRFSSFFSSLERQQSLQLRYGLPSLLVRQLRCVCSTCRRSQILGSLSTAAGHFARFARSLRISFCY